MNHLPVQPRENLPATVDLAFFFNFTSLASSNGSGSGGTGIESVLFILVVYNTNYQHP